MVAKKVARLAPPLVASMAPYLAVTMAPWLERSWAENRARNSVALTELETATPMVYLKADKSAARMDVMTVALSVEMWAN